MDHRAACRRYEGVFRNWVVHHRHSRQRSELDVVPGVILSHKPQTLNPQRSELDVVPGVILSPKPQTLNPQRSELDVVPGLILSPKP